LGRLLQKRFTQNWPANGLVPALPGAVLLATNAIVQGRGRYKMIEDLINNGADVDAQNQRGHSALICAAAAGHEDMVTFLLYSGASAKPCNIHGHSAQDVAEAYGYANIATLLASARA